MLTSSATSEAMNSPLCSPKVRPKSAVATASTPSPTSARMRRRRTVARAYCPAVRPVGSEPTMVISSVERIASLSDAPSPKAATAGRRSHTGGHRPNGHGSPIMRRQNQPSFLSDIRLLLRAHGEHRWLNREVVPVLLDLERPDCIPEEQLGAALAYLEVHWAEAARRAAQTDAAHAELLALKGAGERRLYAMARHYHAVVCNLREVLGARVTEHLAL